MDSFWWPCLIIVLSVFGRTVPSCAAGPPPTFSNPDTTALGVVWTPPSSPDSALHELHRIDRIGATAIRLTHPPSDPVAARADSLDLLLFVDLPVGEIPATQLRDTLARIAPAAQRLQELAQKHPALTHVGLGPTVDTTVPMACETLRRWTERLHNGDAPLRTYYVTPFNESADRCAEAVDQVLLDLRGHPEPTERWRRWHARTEPVGIGALGTWRTPAATTGYRVPHSPQYQARYLEQSLTALLDSTTAAPPVVFVDRWADRLRPPLPARRYGLYARDGTPYPAARVVRGFYTGRQRVFAFRMGPPDARGPHRLVLLGWGLVTLLGLLHATTPFIREMAGRYFTAPGFYRDALRDGRDLSPGAHGLLLAIVAGALGLLGARAAQLAATAPIAEHVLSTLPRGVQFAGAGSLEHPLTASLLIAGTVLTLLTVWTVVLVLMAQWWVDFSGAQGLTVVVWPCWPALLALPLVLAAGPDAPITPSLFGLLLLGGAPALLIYVTGRVLSDYWRVVELPVWVLLPLILLSPPVLLTATVLTYALRHDLSFPFLWHLVTLTS